MGKFEDSLKAAFYDGTNKMVQGTRACLLNASGTPIGSDKVERVSAIMLNKDDVVDLGLPSGTLWAKRNIGALSETDYGWYFSWGNLNGHSAGSGYNFSQATYDATPAASISANLTLAQDAANANLGGMFRMPTQDEFTELFNSTYTTNAWTTNYRGSGINGRLVTSKANGNTLFLPANGFCSLTILSNAGSYGRYWSSSRINSASSSNLAFDSGSTYSSNSSSRFYGFSIRPVI